MRDPCGGLFSHRRSMVNAHFLFSHFLGRSSNITREDLFVLKKKVLKGITRSVFKRTLTDIHFNTFLFQFAIIFIYRIPFPPFSVYGLRFVGCFLYSLIICFCWCYSSEKIQKLNGTGVSIKIISRKVNEKWWWGSVWIDRLRSKREMTSGG